MVRAQVPVPVQTPPLQPVKVEPAAGVAVSVTAVPLANEVEHVAPHVMPAGALGMVPLPAPLLLTVSAKLWTAKVAVTEVAALMVRAQVPVPVQAPPLQPVKVEPAAGVAVSVTAVPLANVEEHVAPHVIPAGALVMVPLPAPVLLTVSAKLCSAKVAVTDCAALIVTLQVPAPVQPPPLQPVKVERAAGVAVSVTAVPLANEAEHVAPHVTPAGALVMVPLPAPLLLTVSAKLWTAKVAVTDCAALIVTAQEPVPVQPPPLQPVKVEPAAGVAVRVTTVPVVKEVEHVAPHVMPAGALVTVPLPAPAFVTVSAKDDCMKVAVTEVAALIVTVQVPVPEHPPPLQPVNVEPAAAAAVSVTDVPLVKEAEHVAPQEIPAGLLVTVPLPAPALETVSVEPVDTPVPLTSRDSVSPSAVKLTLVLAAVALVGANRTVTVAVAPVPTRVKELPETMLKGADAEAVPVTVPVRVLWTVKIWVAELPMATLPKFTAVLGVTAISTWAAALASAEQGLSRPLVSTAVTATL